MASTEKYNKLANKRVLIIGGTSGLGFAVAEASLSSGASVTISSSQQKNIDSAIERLHASYPNSLKPRGFTCDLSKSTVEQDLEKLFEQVGKVDHIIYTAGDKLANMPVQEITLEKIMVAGQIRAFASLLAAKVGSRYLTNPKSPECSIVLTTGSISEHPRPEWTVVAFYATGMLGMTRNLALELKPVRVNCVAPGVVNTEMWERGGMSADAKNGMFDNLANRLPTGRIAGPEDIAEAYLYLMKDRNVTGRCIGTDSGVMLI
jgi:NAD(P)-dependent dehydrogenase (short-subunit alcohol dehydrogenase family)